MDNMEVLKKVAQRYGESRMVYFCMSGSRMFLKEPGECADYDVRAVIIHDPFEYLTLSTKKKYTYEKMFDMDGKKIDLVAHDIYKSMKLLLKGNPNIWMMFNNPYYIIRPIPFHDKIIFNVRAEQDKIVSYKGLFNALRGYSNSLCKDYGKFYDKKRLINFSFISHLAVNIYEGKYDFVKYLDDFRNGTYPYDEDTLYSLQRKLKNMVFEGDDIPLSIREATANNIIKWGMKELLKENRKIYFK